MYQEISLAIWHGVIGSYTTRNPCHYRQSTMR